MPLSISIEMPSSKQKWQETGQSYFSDAWGRVQTARLLDRATRSSKIECLNKPTKLTKGKKEFKKTMATMANTKLGLGPLDQGIQLDGDNKNGQSNE